MEHMPSSVADPSMPTPKFMLPSQMEGIKVRCESPAWSRKLQVLLKEELGCTWGDGIPTPWNERRQFLMILFGLKGWYLSWATPTDYANCTRPEFTARGLVQAHRALTKRRQSSTQGASQ
ncbi:hypothetical protein ABIC83_003039 [Roseateles asaccharophilus]|uniref:hypothetical protein n=1 Tax=Roseateles asaccharophilus TaxID=582607 RepID=UPI003838AA6F